MKPTLFKITTQHKTILKPIKTRITLNAEDNFHIDGLFSLDLFGQVGSKERMTSFSYIKLNTEIISPELYHVMSRLSAFYNGILKGVTFATWNDKKKIFEQSDFENGETGYKFFASHMNDIKWHRTESKTRDQKIAMIEKYRDVTLLSDYLVIPAGMRDYTIKDGKPTEDEINPLYRKLIGYASLLESSDGYSKENDGIRLKIQMVIQEIYDMIMLINSGKGGFIQNVWTKRSIMFGTRNVITGSTLEIKDTPRDRILGENDSMIGLFQYCKGIGTKMDYLLRSRFINRIFGDGSSYTIPLVNPKTGRFEMVNLSKGQITHMSKLMSEDGLDKMLTSKVRIGSYLHEPVSIGKHHLCNIYDDGVNVRPMFDNIVPEGFDKKHIRPMTLIEMTTLAVLKDSEEAVGMMTRYPITQQGSIYPTNLYVRTTTKSRRVKILNDSWEEEYELQEFPIVDMNPYTSMSVDSSKLANLGADYDGDKLALTILLMKESIKEIKDLMKKRIFYVMPSGGYVNSIDDDITGHLLKHITRGLMKRK